jgi:hypothetical protein
MIAVSCEPDGGDSRCSVTVGDDSRATHHQVTVRAEHLHRIAPPGASAEDVVRASFEFLLAREPRESILRSFDLAEISRYFPEYDAELTKALGG